MLIQKDVFLFLKMISLQSTQEIWQHTFDGGPVYHETDFNRFIIEPWNALSSLLFIVPAIFFLIKLRGQYRLYWFLIYLCSPLLITGGLGSTLYHAFRTSRFFLFMDFIPIALLTLSVSIYFWIKILPKWWYVLIIIAASFLLRYVGFYLWEGQTGINISYFITGLMIFVPALLVLVRTDFMNMKYLISAVFFFGLALFFRYADDWENQIFSMGTHWLWHLGTAAGSLLLGMYLRYLIPFQIDRNT